MLVCIYLPFVFFVRDANAMLHCLVNQKLLLDEGGDFLLGCRCAAVPLAADLLSVYHLLFLFLFLLVCMVQRVR